jgi:hypothetical protein
MSDRIPGTSYDNPEWYKNWRIYRASYVPMKGMEMAFVHDEYDPTPIEPFGPPSDHRCGFGHDVNDCKRQIDEMETEE